jgi:hypothetical protein
MYSDEYIQSIYTTAISSKIADASSAVAAPTATTKRVSIAEEHEDAPDDGAEPSATSSYLRLVPPAMRNNPSPVPEIVKQSPPRSAALYKPPAAATSAAATSAAAAAAAASNTTTTNTTSPSNTTISSTAPPPVDRSNAGPRKAPPIFDDEPPPAATGPFVVPVPRSLNKHQHGSRSNLAAAAAASSNTSARPPAPVRSNSNISGNGGAGGTTGCLAVPMKILAFFWNRVFRRYYAMKLFGMLLAIYTAVLSFTYTGTFGRYGGVLDRETGYIIDPNSEENTENGVIVRENGGVARAVVATTSWELVFLAIARLTAFYMYPGT